MTQIISCATSRVIKKLMTQKVTKKKKEFASVHCATVVFWAGKG